jgi:hypothetical protein
MNERCSNLKRQKCDSKRSRGMEIQHMWNVKTRVTGTISRSLKKYVRKP